MLKNKWKNLKTNTRKYCDVKIEDINLTKYYIIDVRNQKEYMEFHLNGSISIPLHCIKQEIEKIQPDKEKKMLVCCQSGIRSKKAIKILEKMGYINLYNLKGGIENIE